MVLSGRKSGRTTEPFATYLPAEIPHDSCSWSGQKTTPNHAIYDTITIMTTIPIRILYPHFSQMPRREG